MMTQTVIPLNIIFNNGTCITWVVFSDSYHFFDDILTESCNAVCTRNAHRCHTLLLRGRANGVNYKTVREKFIKLLDIRTKISKRHNTHNIAIWLYYKYRINHKLHRSPTVVKRMPRKNMLIRPLLITRLRLNNNHQECLQTVNVNRIIPDAGMFYWFVRGGRTNYLFSICAVWCCSIRIEEVSFISSIRASFTELCLGVF